MNILGTSVLKRATFNSITPQFISQAYRGPIETLTWMDTKDPLHLIVLEFSYLEIGSTHI